MILTLFGITVLLQPITKVFEAVAIIALQLSRESNVVLLPSTSMEVRLVRELKALYAISVRPLPILMLVRAVQPWNLQVVLYQRLVC